MFVVFEGIDGSGKTTVSNLVAEALRARGIKIDHVREGGEFASSLVTRMREFGKDSRNLSMRPLAEFLMYLARDAQLLAECIKPNLAKGGLVFADRYFYSYEVLGHYGRGLELEQVRPIIDVVAEGIWPDLVVLMDVDPYVARARRRVGKIRRKADGEPGSGGSRKGLAGVGMQHRLRQGYLSLAAQQPKKWLVIDNSSTDLTEVVERVTEAIASLYEGASAERVIQGTTVATRASSSAGEATVEAARDAFFEMIEQRGQSDPAVAAYFLAGLVDPEAHTWRERFVEDAPHVVAHGLRALGDEGSWALRERLKEQSPRMIARSLAGTAVEGERANAMRRELMDVVPLAVLNTQSGKDSEFAWELRDRMRPKYPTEVLASLQGMDDERAWSQREKFIEERGEEALFGSLTALRSLLSSLKGLGNERAWSLRNRAIQVAPAEMLRSLSLLDCEESWALRDEYVALAPKIVMRTFDGQDSDKAWALRRRFAPKVKESLEGMIGLGSEAAWGIREALKDTWPSTVAKSLGALAATERGLELIQYLLGEYPDNLSLLKHATQVAAARATAGAARRGQADVG